MLAIRSILAPTDFSPHAEAGLRYAAGLAERLGTALHLLHVLPDIVAPVGPDPSIVATMPPEYYPQAEREAAEALGAVLKEEWGRPASVVSAVLWGDPVEQTCDYARAHGIDLIVIATHGRTGLSHVLLGSTAERIVREAPCPVLTVRSPGVSG